MTISADENTCLSIPENIIFFKETYNKIFPQIKANVYNILLAFLVVFRFYFSFLLLHCKIHRINFSAEEKSS